MAKSITVELTDEQFESFQKAFESEDRTPELQVKHLIREYMKTVNKDWISDLDLPF